MQVRIKKFEEDLETYTKQVDEFQSFGDIEELPKYLKKAVTLDSRLAKSIEIIDQFNAEERAYNFEESVYPLRKQVRIFGQCNDERFALSTKITYYCLNILIDKRQIKSLQEIIRMRD